MYNEEKRSFRRYENHSECEIRVDSKTFKGRIIDYSDGIGAVLKDAPSLQLGKVVDIRIYDPEMDIKAKTVWVEKAGDELKVGFSRIDDLQGSLENFALADILIGLQRSTRTGVLIIEKGATVKGIFIKNGDMISAYSNNREDRLGDFLLRQKKITLEEYNRANDLTKNKKERLGRVLVELKYLKPEEVFQAVQQHMEEIILSLIAFRNGRFKFRKGLAPPDEFITLHISAANIIYRGIKLIDSPEHIKQALPPMDALLDISPSPINIFQDIELEEVDRIILSYINGMYSLDQILSIAPSDDFDTLKSVCALLGIGMITVRKGGKPSASVKAENILKEPEEEVTEEFVGKLNVIFSRCKDMRYYEILGLDKESSDEEISTAYYQLSKQFHPDRHFDLSSDDLKEKLTRVFSYITRAYETLSDPGMRAEYDRTLDTEYAATVDEPLETLAPEDAELEALYEPETSVEELNDEKRSAEEDDTAGVILQESPSSDKAETVPSENSERSEESIEEDFRMADEPAVTMEKEPLEIKIPEGEESDVVSSLKISEDEITGEADIMESGDMAGGVPLETPDADIEKPEEKIEVLQSETAKEDQVSGLADEGKIKRRPVSLIAAAAVVLAVLLSITYYVFLNDEPESPEINVQNSTEAEDIVRLPAFRDELFEKILNKTPKKE